MKFVIRDWEEDESVTLNSIRQLLDWITTNCKPEFDDPAVIIRYDEATKSWILDRYWLDVLRSNWQGD